MSVKQEGQQIKQEKMGRQKWRKKTKKRAHNQAFSFLYSMFHNSQLGNCFEIE